jgi:hypothetical protein
MRILTILSLSFAIGCGGGGSTLTEVGELSTNSQVDLCTDFVQIVCDVTTDPGLDGFCADPCITDQPASCAEASESLEIDEQCAAVFVEEVEDCFNSGGDPLFCDDGGGCMFDALDTVCPV